MSFLDKLKVKVEQIPPANTGGGEVRTENAKKNTGFMQLDVDIIQTPSEIIVFAPIPGIDMKDIDISIENENDVVTIQGRRDIPIGDEVAGNDMRYLRQECQWGSFYRQIILPQEVNVAEVRAKFKKGILVLHLPVLRLQVGGKKKIEIVN